MNERMITDTHGAADYLGFSQTYVRSRDRELQPWRVGRSRVRIYSVALLEKFAAKRDARRAHRFQRTAKQK